MAEDYAARLREMVGRLEAAHETLVARLSRDFSCDPYEVTDTAGTPLLLESLTAIVRAQTALANTSS